MHRIDLNCDMGESFGAYSMGTDEAIMDYVSSINVACGFHAGDPSVMRKTIALAAKRNIVIGAHPGYPDLQGFGRRKMDLSPEEIYDSVIYQVGALQAFVHAVGKKLHHVKPHGALYNVAAKDKSVAKALAQAVYDVDKDLVFVGLSGSLMIEEANGIGLLTASEVFADRTYQDDGTLTPRTSPRALMASDEDATSQVLQMIKQGTVTSVNGKTVNVKADTVCIHGDGKHALSFVKSIVKMLEQHHVTIKHF
ncbi:LamB/YcsF family protein [Chryseosolibacter indicus]|uniref:5-oxoprolinase subunit A n=1 Tax=Chryseosolibacter indicus TaxID=2782351 RepID=A0ABS5VSG6_9BACT|nr:5-oxoprolinase subunit PxpA [Chryseosolibacter indicus]MBT1704385.1 LamB/YcsF family protein [Chryseosolibacter indicus]